MNAASKLADGPARNLPYNVECDPVHVACLCAAWCRLCDDYAPVFERVTQALRALYPLLQTHWIDIEDEAELLGDFDVETFPTLVVVVGEDLRFAGPLAPQPETLQRVLATVLSTPQPGMRATPAVQAFARRLRLRTARAGPPR